MQKLKIGIVMDTSLDPPDGVQQYVVSIRDWLVSQGHEVHLLVGETIRTDIPNIHSLSKNVSVTFNGNKMTIPLWANRREVKKVLQEHSFDVLHVQSPHHPLMAQYIMISAPKRTAIVTTFHILPYGRIAALSTKLLGLALKPSLKRVDVALAVSRSAAIFATKSFGLPYDVSSNVFDYQRFQSARCLPQYDDKVKTILFLGRLVERKGCQHLLNAVARLDRTALPSFRVVICGKGELLPKLQQFVADNGLDDVVTFVGFVSEDDKPRYYASADIAVFPSTSGESFGIVLLEAMASGASIVYAGDNPGYATVMEPRPDQLFNPTSTDEMAAMLTKSLCDDSLRTERAAWGSSYVANFDVKMVGPRLVGHYMEAIAKRRAKQDNKD